MSGLWLTKAAHACGNSRSISRIASLLYANRAMVAGSGCVPRMPHILSRSTSMKFIGMGILALALGLGLQGAAKAGEAKLVRYPDYHDGKIAFAYLGDIWTADDSGKNVQRLTVNKARDVYPRFSPDGQWIAFSSDREGNLDVYTSSPPPEALTQAADAQHSRRRHGARLGAGRQEHPLRQPARRRLHGQALYRHHRRQADPRRRPRYGRHWRLPRPTARSS